MTKHLLQLDVEENLCALPADVLTLLERALLPLKEHRRTRKQYTDLLNLARTCHHLQQHFKYTLMTLLPRGFCVHCDFYRASLPIMSGGRLCANRKNRPLYYTRLVCRRCAGKKRCDGCDDAACPCVNGNDDSDGWEYCGGCDTTLCQECFGVDNRDDDCIVCAPELSSDDDNYDDDDDDDFL